MTTPGSGKLFTESGEARRDAPSGGISELVTKTVGAVSGMSSDTKTTLNPSGKSTDTASSPTPTSSPGITFKIAPHDSNEVLSTEIVTDSPERVLSQVWERSSMVGSTPGNKCQELLQSSMPRGPVNPMTFSPSTNGFVHTVVKAYSRHYNLVIRPDDVWIAILSQLNIYVNANSEELRSMFVAHEGKKKLRTQWYGTRYTQDYGEWAQAFAALLRKNVLDPSFCDFILPNFSTTTSNDTIIASVMMMSTLKAYFSYYGMIDCGIPAITLQGEQKDYMMMLSRLDRLDTLGEEPRAFALLLRPILRQFIAAFDAVKAGSQPDIEFWGRICHEHINGSGPSYLAGWISAFCAWNSSGKWQGPKIATMQEPLSPGEEATHNEYYSHIRQDRPGYCPPELVVDGVRYPIVDLDSVPNGFCDVEVEMNDNGNEFECMMVSGHVGMAISSTDGKRDTVQPSPQWFMFITKDK